MRAAMLLPVTGSAKHNQIAWVITAEFASAF
jgi:hypothetical protein